MGVLLLRFGSSYTRERDERYYHSTRAKYLLNGLYAQTAARNVSGGRRGPQGQRGGVARVVGEQGTQDRRATVRTVSASNCQGREIRSVSVAQGSRTNSGDARPTAAPDTRTHAQRERERKNGDHASLICLLQASLWVGARPMFLLQPLTCYTKVRGHFFWKGGGGRTLKQTLKVSEWGRCIFQMS